MLSRDHLYIKAPKLYQLGVGVNLVKIQFLPLIMTS